MKATMKKALQIVVMNVFILFFAFNSKANDEKIPIITLNSPNTTILLKEDLKRDKAGMLYRVGVANSVNLNSLSNGTWTILPNRNRKWQLAISNPGAQSLSFIFKTFILEGNSKFWVENTKGEKVSNVLTSEDMLEDFQQNIAMCKGDFLILNLLEEAYTDPSKIELDRVFYNYRSTLKSKEKINESASCQINVNCSEGEDFQDEKRGVARVYIIEGNSAGFCSGSLVNNLAKDCKPLFLTALHCGISTSANDMNLWQFYFNYEAPTCSNPSSEGSLANNYVTGCIRLSDSNDNGGNTGSDFLLLQLGSVQNEASTITKLKGTNFQAYWNGWDANNVTSSNGKGIHHPSGDIKKISSYTSSLTSTSYGGSVSNTHWSLSWSATTNGHGVTEGGSSGSPLFTYNNGNSRIVGTLTGGSSYCNYPTDIDLYGKMSYHWSGNGGQSSRRASTYLDPLNSGIKVLDGSSNPCSLADVPMISIQTKLEIYPNPSNDILYVKSSNDSEMNIMLFDMLGNLIYENTAVNLVHELDLKSLTSGVYQLKITQGNTSEIRAISKL